MLLHQRIVELHGLRHGKQRLVIEPVLKYGGGHGGVAGLVGGYDEGCIVGHVVHYKQAGLRLTHGAWVTGQADGLDGVDIVMYGVAVHMAGDEIGDHLHCHIVEVVAPGIEYAAPDGLVMGHGVIPGIGLLAPVELGVGHEHALELAYGLVDHASVMPGGGSQGFAPHALHAPVEPVEHRQVGLAHPAVAPHALGKVYRAAHLHDVLHHEYVVIEPDHVEVVQGIFYASPLPVLIKAGLILIQFPQAALAVGLAVPEVSGKLFDVHFFLSHFTCPPGSS